MNAKIGHMKQCQKKNASVWCITIRLSRLLGTFSPNLHFFYGLTCLKMQLGSSESSKNRCTYKSLDLSEVKQQLKRRCWYHVDGLWYKEVTIAFSSNE